MKININKKASVLDEVPNNLPELIKSVELTNQAAKIGFDWSTIEPVFAKIQEEIAELKEAMLTKSPERIKDELGDVLFVCTNLARHLQINPQDALKHANKKFENRFRSVEKIAYKNHPKQKVFALDLLDELWNRVKLQEK